MVKTMSPDPRLNKLAEIFKIIQDSVTKEEFVVGLEALRKRVETVGAGNEREFALMKGAIDALSMKVKADAGDGMKEMRAMMKDLSTKIMAQMTEVDEKIDMVKDGEDAPPIDPASIVPFVIAALPEDPEETGDEIISKINGATELISKSAIEGMAALEKAVAEKTGNTTRIGWGAHPITVYHNSTVIDKNTRVINFASGLTVSRNAAGVVTVSATSGGVTELTATGAINSSNTTFTFISKPVYVYVDGTKYRENEGWTWNAGTLTATVTKAPDFSIWGES